MYHPLNQLLLDGTAPTTFAAGRINCLPYGVPQDAILRVRVENRSSSANLRVAIRPNGNTTIVLQGADYPVGVSGADIANVVGVAKVLWVAVTDGQFEICSSVAQSCKIYLEGWFDSTIVDPLCAGTPTLNGVSVTAIWTNDLNLSAVVGARRAMVLLEVTSASTDKVAWRSSDNNVDTLLEYTTSGLKTIWENQPNGGIASTRHVILVTTGPDGKVDASTVNGTITLSAFIHGYIVDGLANYADASFGAVDLNSYPTEDTVDLTSILGDGFNGIVELQVANQSLSTARHSVATAPDGEAIEVDQSATSGGGEDQIALIDWDEHIPVVSSVSPLNGATGVATNAAVIANFTDAGGDVNPNNTSLMIDGVWAMITGEWQPGYGNQKSASTVGCTTHPPFVNGASITCSVYIYDYQGSSASRTWTFTVIGAS